MIFGHTSRITRKAFVAHACVGKPSTMAEPVPAGSDVSAGTYKCTNCGNELSVGSTNSLPPCPSCGNGAWTTLSGGDSREDPYPDQS
jgi:hypothetical protein